MNAQSLRFEWSLQWLAVSCALAFVGCTNVDSTDVDGVDSSLSKAGLSGSALTNADRANSAVSANNLTEATVNRIQTFCGDCHPLPLASTFPKSSWQKEVEQGFNFYYESKRNDLPEPTLQEVVRYYRDAAPEKVIVPRADQLASAQSTVKFERSAALGIGEVAPATAHVVWNAATKSLLFTDMQVGTLRKWTPTDSAITRSNATTTATSQSLSGTEELLASGRNICRVHVCDWNSDGMEDYLLGELGSFPVGDHKNGRVTLRLGQVSGTPATVVLAENLGRVVEAKPIDYDEDGDLDVLVAEFGWLKTGSLILLRNTGGSLTAPEMQVEILDSRHGPLGVEICDLNGDSKSDFVVAYGQEFESVEAFVNLGGGQFQKQMVLELPDPSFNSSSFQIVDLDGDGKLDVVHTCGDVMDAYIPKPYHGLRWVQNLGDGKWKNHELGLLVGALQSTVADFDGDGDLDIAAVGLFPQGAADGPGAYDSICWWEQKENLEFTRHSIERDHCAHATCTSADVNCDGRVDLIVGEWLDTADKAAFRVFLNLPAPPNGIETRR